jgi:hypothetical protein
MMKTIGTCSICGGPVQVPEEITSETTSTMPKCANCGATPESPHGPTLKMKSSGTSSLDELRKTLDTVVDRWCPKINKNAKEAPPESFEQRMAKALLNINAFEIDYRRVLAGGKPLNVDYPLPFPVKTE